MQPCQSYRAANFIWLDVQIYLLVYSDEMLLESCKPWDGYKLLLMSYLRNLWWRSEGHNVTIYDCRKIMPIWIYFAFWLVLTQTESSLSLHIHGNSYTKPRICLKEGIGVCQRSNERLELVLASNLIASFAAWSASFRCWSAILAWSCPLPAKYGCICLSILWRKRAGWSKKG